MAALVRAGDEVRAMAERTVSAFGREHAFPHMTVFADRNRVEREETFELASAARDRFMFELSMLTPDEEEIRRSLVFDPAFHDVDALLDAVPEGLCPGEALNGIGADIQRFVKASPAIERYVLDVWRASAEPARYGIAIEGVDVRRLVLAGASARGMSALVRAARVVAWLDGRDHLRPEDLQRVLPSALAHRVFFSPVYELRRTEIAPALVAGIVGAVASP